MLFTITYVRRGFVLILASFLLSSGLMASTARVESCSSCYSSASFHHRAEQFSLSTFPGFEGIDMVYVVNLHTRTIKFFHVDRWVDNSFQPYGLPSQGLNFNRSRGQQLDGYFRAEAVEMPGDPYKMAEIGAGIEAVFSFSQLVASGISVDDLPDLDIDSAVALVGPADSPASFNRMKLQNALRDHLNTNWQTIRLGLADLALRAVKRFLGDGELQVLSFLTITFPDGTSIIVKIEEILSSIDGTDLDFDLEVDTSSARGPGLPGVPQSPGEFNGFSYSGNTDTLSELAMLAQMFNIPVVAAGSGGGRCSMSCEIDGDTLKCRLSCTGN